MRSGIVGANELFRKSTRTYFTTFFSIEYPDTGVHDYHLI